jgi:hypothetical protein
MNLIGVLKLWRGRGEVAERKKGHKTESKKGP